MNLQIHDPRAHELARQLPEWRGVSMTEAVIDALEEQLRREGGRKRLAERLAAIADPLSSQAGSGGHEMTSDEIDRMWVIPDVRRYIGDRGDPRQGR